MELLQETFIELLTKHEGLIRASIRAVIRRTEDVDEVAIWNRALSQTEVLSQTEKGCPSLLWSRENPPLRTPMPIPNS